jgi:acyl-coenzyme A synthetase/AMP-(fatty) acid ligase
MPRNDSWPLWNSLSTAGSLAGRFLAGAGATVCLSDVVPGSCLNGRAGELRGRSVLVSTKDQLTAALALIELDGIARRLVLCPSDFPLEHLPFVVDAASVDVVVSDQTVSAPNVPGVDCVPCSAAIVPADYDRGAPLQTEWILLTSGTTGLPKLVLHTLASLAGAIKPSSAPASSIVWSTFYDIRRYGGLQIFLRAILTGTSLVLSDAKESTADFLSRAGQRGVTHISGTPSHWRHALMSPAASRIAPQYVRLSGEIADQAILTSLQSCYPQARVAHAFASTEAGLAFEVNDGLEGFPQSLIGAEGDVAMKIEDGSLRIRSPRIAKRYLGSQAEPLQDADGFVDTRDMLELRGDRYYFVGRRDGVINIGGLKVYPEEVEAVINRHPRVRMSLVRTRKSPITGAIVVADVVLQTAPESAGNNFSELQSEILLLCRKSLPPHKVPATIKFVADLAVAETGKLTRSPCAT